MHSMLLAFQFPSGVLNNVFMFSVCKKHVKDVSKFACNISLGSAFSSQLCVVARCAFMDMVVHHKGHMDPSQDLCWALDNLAFAQHATFWMTFLECGESCESDPIFRESFVSTGVPIVARCCGPPNHPNWSLTAVSRRCTSEGSGTTILAKHLPDRGAT